jgi:uncharacterized protein YkwD
VAYCKARRLLGAGVLTLCALVPAGTAAASENTAIVKKVNNVRAQHGLRRLKMLTALDQAAAAHCTEMLVGQSLSHGALRNRLQRYLSARSYGETLAWMPSGIATPASVVSAWMHSPPHRAVLLSKRFRRIGVAAQNGTLGGQVGTSYTIDVAS